MFVDDTFYLTNCLINVQSISNPISADTAQIINQGFYYNQHQEEISIADALQFSILNTLYFEKDHQYLIFDNPNRRGIIEVTAEDVVSCSERLIVKENHENCVILNFANGVFPGGGWAYNAMAQEECIMRVSGGYASIISKPEFYIKNSDDYAVSTDALIYSPNVPFFKNSQNEVLDYPFTISMITSPAVIANEYSSHEQEVYRIMEERCRKIIYLAIQQGDTNIALGAFGCGAFGNDPNQIATIFKKILITEGYRTYFDYIVFPIPEYHGKSRSTNIDPFAQILDVPIRRFDVEDEAPQ